MKTSFLILISIFSSCFLKSQNVAIEEKYPQSIIIKTIEVFSHPISPFDIISKMIVIDADNQIEEKTLDDVGAKNKNENIKNNATKLKYELQKWHNLGFMVKTSNCVVPGEYVLTTYILQKN
jgi:hypothetical protein